MKTFKQLISEVEEPKSSGEANFKKKHKVDVIDPLNYKDQNGSDKMKTDKSKASNKDGKDKKEYDEVVKEDTLDEISKERSWQYTKKSLDDIDSGKKVEKRTAGVKLAVKKIGNDGVKVGATKPKPTNYKKYFSKKTNESTDLDEDYQERMAEYINRAIEDCDVIVEKLDSIANNGGSIRKDILRQIEDIKDSICDMYDNMTVETDQSVPANNGYMSYEKFRNKDLKEAKVSGIKYKGTDAEEIRTNMPGFIGPDFAKKASPEDIVKMAELKDKKTDAYNKYLGPVEKEIMNLRKKYKLR